VTGDELDDELQFLLDSLEDLERERAAGDLSETDYVVLRDRYTRRAAEVLRTLEPDATTPGATDRPFAVPTPDGTESEVFPRPGSPGGSVSDTAPPPARRRRTLLVGGSLAVVAAVAVIVVVTQTGTRLPGQTATGSVSLSGGAEQRRTLAQAEELESSGNAAEALRLFQQVLAQDPDQPDALAQSGWLEFEAGVTSKNATVLSQAQNQEQAAARADPGAYAPHLYLGSMFLAEGNAADAVTQYRQFLADGPPPAEVQAAQPFIDQAFQKVGEAVPALPGTSPTTTTRPEG
jgi:tetratricopeptide (TPR) repeat protein